MRDGLSLAEQLAVLPPQDRAGALDALSDSEVAKLLHDWRFYARPKQLPPPGDWLTWVVRAGRGFGKTRTGAGWTHERAMAEPGRWLAYVAKTPADARDYMVEGPGGILKHAPAHERPDYEPSKRRLTWPNESWATIYSSEEPDQLRGFSGDTAWLDELAKYKNPREVWDNLQFGMREVSEDQPRVLITTTPRPLTLLTDLEAKPTTVVVTGSSYENRANLSPVWFKETLQEYEGTRMGRQEIHAEILDDVPGALWTRSMIEEGRAGSHPVLTRVVVAVDPAVTSGESADMTGIVVAGVEGGEGYVLADRTCRLSPERWARTAVDALHEFSADRIVAETNNGGDLVETVLRSVDPDIPYRKVSASRGKRTRAEPVAALYEQGRIHHVGGLPDLEDQMCAFTPEQAGADSPDRVDALVWAFTDLMLTKPDHPPVRVSKPMSRRMRSRQR